MSRDSLKVITNLIEKDIFPVIDILFYSTELAWGKPIRKVCRSFNLAKKYSYLYLPQKVILVSNGGKD